MMTWVIREPYTGEALGLIPSFLSEDDPRPAAEQFNERYVSGWKPMPGFTLETDGKLIRLRYPGDPPFRPIAVTMLRDEIVWLFEHEIVLIMKPDKSFEAARMD